MNGSWHFGKLAGIDIRIHWTFLLLPLWIYASSLVAGSGILSATISVLFVVTIFCCIVMHELGHSLMARQFGIATQDITLLPIGGVASLQRIPRSPWQELAIAIAGPAVNVVIAALIFVALRLPAASDPALISLVALMTKLAWVNVALVAFNMLPAFPMDGGRVLRAVLAIGLPYGIATKIAAGSGQVLAVGFALLGLYTGNLMLLLLAGFVFVAARGEASSVAMEDQAEAHRVQLSETTEMIPVEIGMVDVRNLPIVSAHWNARSALGWLSSDTIDDFLVSSGGSVLGVVRKRDLSDAVRKGLGSRAIGRLLATNDVPLRGLGSA
jgi:Zn-dependent protease